MIWNPTYESMSRRELEQLQLERLKKTVALVYDKVPFYKKAFDDKGLKPEDLKTLADLARFPFTVKNDLRENYPFALFARPMEEIVRVHCSSGTTGKPIVGAYTRNDIETWAELMARTLSCGGTAKRDIVQNAYGYGLFTGGLGVHYGVEKIGATVVPISGGNTKRQLMLMVDFGSTILTCTPSYSLFLAEVAKEMNLADKIKVKCALLGAEPWTQAMRESVERELKFDAIDIYGLTEVIGPGVSSECLEKVGLHIFEDHFYPEIVDPDTLEPLPEGETGELVFTSLTKEAFPIVRYRTRDITSLTYEPCACGRSQVRMQRVTGRTDDMLIIRGVNVFPSQIESVLIEMEETLPHYQLVVTRDGNLDNLEVQVEVNEYYFSDEIKKLESIRKKIGNEIQSVLGIAAVIKLVEPKTIERSEGKAKRVIDKRNLG